jgi:hypothetical protein
MLFFFFFLFPSFNFEKVYGCLSLSPLLPLIAVQVVVQAIRQLAAKYPAKYRSLLQFLNNVLRDEGGKEFKRSIVETILSIMNTIPEAKVPHCTALPT